MSLSCGHRGTGSSRDAEPSSSYQMLGFIFLDSEGSTESSWFLSVGQLEQIHTWYQEETEMVLFRKSAAGGSAYGSSSPGNQENPSSPSSGG